MEFKTIGHFLSEKIKVTTALETIILNIALNFEIFDIVKS